MYQARIWCTNRTRHALSYATFTFSVRQVVVVQWHVWSILTTIHLRTWLKLNSSLEIPHLTSAHSRVSRSNFVYKYSERQTIYRLVLFFRNSESIVYNNISHLIIEYIEVSPYTDTRDVGNLTPLHYACVGGHIQLVKYLVEELKCDVGEWFP